MEIPDQLLRVVFDVAVSSDDFCSGFVDDSEVEALREIAVLLGANPDDATPARFRCKYRGHHAAVPYLDQSMFVSFADGLWRKAYRRREPGRWPPPGARGKSPAAGMVRPESDYELVMLEGPRIGMWCPDCGLRWDAFEDTSYGAVQHREPPQDDRPGDAASASENASVQEG